MGRANGEAFRRFSARRGGSNGPFLVLTLQQFFRALPADAFVVDAPGEPCSQAAGYRIQC